MIKLIQTISRLLPTNCLSVFDHSMGFALKGLSLPLSWWKGKVVSGVGVYDEMFM